MTRFCLVAAAAVVAAGVNVAPAWAQVAADETRIQVRVLARDAKLIGDAVGGARVTITDAGSGEPLAEGVTRGETGDTDLIMRTPRERERSAFDTPGAAGWLATFDLRRPTLVEIAAEGPLDYPRATARASKTMVVAPGAEILGDGVVLELNGFIVEILEPGESPSPDVDGTDGYVSVHARVRMLCSCPTEPDGLWSAGRVTGRLLDEGEVVAEAPLEYSGEPSVYGGEIRAPEPGRYTLQVLAADPSTGNFGSARREIEVRAQNAAAAAPPEATAHSTSGANGFR